MALDTRYVLESDLQGLFRDKDTGLPLRNGYIKFFRDDARTTPKPVYELTGSPPNYSYAPLPTTLPLTAIGTYSDGNNNDIVPYWFPYASTDANAAVELYYVEVYSEDDVLQFTREAWPNTGAGSVPEQDFKNYVDNGQFLFHENLPAYNLYKVGQIRQPITILGQGGWTYEVPAPINDVDIVTFERFNSPASPSDPTGNPRYSIRINAQSVTGGSTYKDLRIKFLNVNTFASASQYFTFAFYGKTNAGFITPVEFILIKNFGSGGSSETQTVKATFNIANAWGIYQVPFIFGDNSGKILGDGDDDYLQLTIRFPLVIGFDVSFTDFILALGNVEIQNYPTETEAEATYKSIAGWLARPNPDNSDIYLPILLTPTGLDVDRSQIGKVFTRSDFQPVEIGELAADGNQYEYIAISSDGIPYKRLGDKYWNSSANYYVWGTGANYFIGATSSSAVELRIDCNSSGLVTVISDGPGPNATGFAFATAHTGAVYYCAGYYNSTNQFYLINQYPGIVAPPAAATSGFTFTYSSSTANAQFRFLCETTAATAGGGLGGKYFTFETLNGGVLDKWYVWFQVDGVGANPSPGGGYLPILVDLNSDYTAADVAQVIREALNGWQISTARPVAAASIPPSSFFNVSSTAVDYYVWYKIGGVGTDPKPSSRTGIEVDLTGTETIAQVVTATQIAINQKYYAVPDLRGLFIRGFSDSSIAESIKGVRDWGPRLGYVPGSEDGNFATYEFDDNREHNHDGSYVPATADSGGGGHAIEGTNESSSLPIVISDNGTYESRPVNVNLNYIIKY